MKKSLIWLLTIVAVISMIAAFSFTGCKTTAAVETTAATETTAEVGATTIVESDVVAETVIDRSKDHYVYVGNFMSLDYCTDHFRAANMIKEEWPEVKIDILGPSDNNPEATFAIASEQIAKKVTGLLLQPWDESWIPSINQAIDAGVPVILVGADLPQTKRLAYCGTGNTRMGSAAAEWLAEKIGYKGKIAIMRNPTLSNVTERYNGFVSTIENYPDIEIVADLDHKNDSNVGAQLMVGVLQQHPDLAAVWGGDGISGPAVAMGIREAGLEKGSVIIVGADREDTLLAAIEDGEITATVVQGVSLEFYYAIKIFDAYVHNYGPKASYDDDAAGIKLIPDVVNPKVSIVTKDNVQYFRRDSVEDPLQM